MFGFMNKSQLPFLQQTVANTIININISSSNNFCVTRAPLLYFVRS